MLTTDEVRDLPFGVTGVDLEPTGDVDCVRVSLPTLGGIVAEVVGAGGRCAGNLTPAVAVFPVLIALNVTYQRRVDRYFEAAQHELGLLSSAVHESMSAARPVARQ